MRKILFRADAAPHIGIGDLMSLINISKYFDETYEKYFIIKDYKAGVELVKKYDLQNCFIIDSTTVLKDEITYINNFIDSYDIDILFFEITERKLSEYSGISEKIKKVAVNFDGNILDDLDLVIDWDVEAHKFFDIKKYPNTRFLLGPEYVILPKEFYSKKVKIRKFNLTNKKVLIAMGGADEFDFTGKVVDSIIRFNLEIELNVITGSGYEYKDILEARLNNSGVKYQIKHNITNMLDEYLACDIGIGAGGLTSSELVATKVSPILIATYKHQIARCEYFDEKGWAKYLGYRELSDSELRDAITNPIKPLDKNIFNTSKIVELIDELF
ncbi:glycosyltransferase [Sulfurimonas sp.]|uniref:glycosyltransferase n=1 Tax=Sulfurimonas sp. TaxID=2022749 RepID=UPI002633CCB3|nr:glycosyltransferase [Sulfurimonas sp.]MCW8895340.1 glycosyltransferase [Sulfurimonas sp.]